DEVHVEARAASADVERLYRPCGQSRDHRVGAEEYPGRGQGILAPRVRSDRHQVEGFGTPWREGAQLRDGPVGWRNRRRSGEEVAIGIRRHEDPLSGRILAVACAKVRGDMAQSISNLR